MSLVVVPELPQSRVSAGAASPCMPFPWTVTTPFLFSMSIPMLAETADRGESQAIGALQKVMDLRGSLRDGSEHDTAVGDGFIARDRDLAPRTWSALCNFIDKFLVIDVRVVRIQP